MGKPRFAVLLREPLLHFVLLGAGLFALHGWLGGTGALSTQTIVIDRGRIDQLSASFALMHQRPPMADELQGLIDGAVKEEIYYREALAEGLDRDDVIVRRRLRQKLEFVSEDIAPVPEPGDAQLQAWLDAHPARYAIAPHYTFEQVFLDPVKRGAKLPADAEALRMRLRRGPIVDIAALGDPLLVPHDFRAVSAADVRAQFGARFATALDTLPRDTWQGPVRSGYGVHLVRLIARDAGRAPPLADVRQDVRNDWMHAQREAANAAFYASLRKRYDVRVELPAPHAAVGDGAATVAELQP